jgi:hypothetical protein
MFLQELNPQQNTLVQQVNAILGGTGLFVESGVSKDKDGTLVLYAVPKWIFKGMTDNVNPEDIYFYSVEIPLEQHTYVMSSAEIQAASSMLSVKFLQSYCTDGREIVKEYSPSIIEESFRKHRSETKPEESNDKQQTTETSESGMAV